MRVTFNSQYRDAAAGIEIASERMAEFQRQVSTGLRVEKPSDDPSAASALVTERTQLARVEQYSQAANSVSSRLTVVDTVLSDIIQKLSAAQSATLGAMGSLKSDADREAAAQTVLGIRAALLEDMNTSFHGTYVFAGGAATTKPYAAGGGGAIDPYAGSTTEVAIDIGENRDVTVGFDGSAITLGSDATDLFAEIDALVIAIRAGANDDMTTGSAALRRAMDRATTAQMRVGVGMQAVASEQSRLEAVKIATTTRVSSLEDANMAEAISGMSQADAAYRAALGAVGTASRVSLMDYLG